MAAALPAGQTAQQPAQNPAFFRQMTTRRAVPVNALSHTAYSQTLTREMPRVGFVANLLLQFAFTVTTGSGTPAGSWAAFSDGFNPFNFIKRVRLYTADGATLYDVSGQGLYLLQLALGFYTAPDSSVLTQHNANVFTALQSAPTGAVAASTAYKFNGFAVLPIQLDERSQRGLYLAQTTQSTLYLDITTNDASVIERGLSGLAASTVAGTCSVEMDVFDVPNNPQAWPPTLIIPQVLEGQATPAATGDQSFIFQNGPIYNRILISFENNNAMALMANIDRLVLRFGQSIYLRDETYPLHMIGNYSRKGTLPPEGSVIYNVGFEGAGDSRVYDPRDRFDSRRLAQFEHRLTINSGVTLTSPKIRYITHSMIRRAQGQAAG